MSEENPSGLGNHPVISKGLRKREPNISECLCDVWTRLFTAETRGCVKHNMHFLSVALLSQLPVLCLSKGKVLVSFKYIWQCVSIYLSIAFPGKTAETLCFCFQHSCLHCLYQSPGEKSTRCRRCWLYFGLFLSCSPC